MILIITHKEDYTADFVINKLNNAGIKYFRFNCEDLDKINYFFENESNLIFNLNNVQSIKSIWFRRTKLPDLNLKNESDKIFILADYEMLLENIYSVLESKKWLSHPKHVYQAENKIYQLRTAKDIGFKIPDTLITNQHLLLEKFIKKHNENVIIKPIRQGRINHKNGLKSIFTNKISMSTINGLNEFIITPCIFQEYIDKEYELRITIVGNKCFSAKVNSQKFEESKIDWRKKNLKFEQYLLPKEISDMCLKLTQKLNLSFGAIDLIRNNKGEYVFLEINPNGQWAWLETDAGLKISDEIINFLE
ncbi:hypothetical protein G9H64_13150 [Aquirufa nivalisilvae]|uniref:MvdC/MvdD family ATP grasp protein n=1 Tax=Aquirufa nivalisilvae TaxID=2516557 RepID=UPI0022A90BC4|nr:hypothetical protein [Aquirufa nivalisilvae]MCZ2483908.1 hypothetical protein [Aquirufa nivalisilvae]